jgi:CRISPR/Cas system-associated exonuclease Cas4 (RecB family)
MDAIVTSSSASARLARARGWLSAHGPHERLLVVAATPEAAFELVRSIPVAAGFGWERLTLGQLAARLAAPALAERGLAPLGPLGVEAVCARLVHALRGRLGRFEPVGDRPGLPRALARSLQELRLGEARPPDADLLRLLEAYEAELARARLADRAEVLRLALQAPRPRLPCVLLDVAIATALERRLAGHLSHDLLATVPAGDERTLRHLSLALSAEVERVEAAGTASLARVQRDLFAEASLPEGPLGDDVAVLSAPGESRECVEIARLALREAERGVPFDRMAILLRSPQQYRALLEEALGRAGIPAHFAKGTMKPSPAGRAFLALLSCAREKLSARAFAEYLSLGEVPDATPAGPEQPEVEPQLPADPEAPVAAGGLRAPRLWEKLLVDAAVIGGRDRWERRLSGLAALLSEKLGAEEDEARREGLRRSLESLGALRAFALPLLSALAALPQSATWGEWLEQLSALATQALRDPQRVLSLLAELAPMAPVGPVAIDEVRLVLARRLGELSVPPSGRRYGRLTVAPVDAVRGLSFDVVFVPGLAEKMFPQKVSQDPLLRDQERAGLPDLEVSEDRVAAERLALRLAAGAASQRLVLSYPRLDLQQARPRVPSFYGLEVLRAAEGRLPGFAELARRAEISSGARIGWPAPRAPRDAIDEAEHDLALLEHAFHAPPDESRGTAHYLLSANPHLARALRARARRWRRRWTPADGLVEPSPEALAALQAHALSARSYSPTALQNYAACPYRFFLQAVHRLSPREEPRAIDELDPLARGSLIHEIQFELLSELSAAGALPVKPETLEAAQARLDTVLARIAARYADDLAPAIGRVWDDGVAGIRADLREWLRRASLDTEWTPWRFELSFGLADRGGRDPHSTEAPAALEQGLQLRGSIDLVERNAAGSLRATDSKSGKVRAQPGAVIGGGATLQPALYALALEKLFPEARVEAGRLYYCTFTGDFSEVSIPLDQVARDSIRAVAQTVGDAIARGFLPAAPAERECNYCDYRPVCGEQEEFRVKRKPREQLEPLVQLRRMP